MHPNVPCRRERLPARGEAVLDTVVSFLPPATGALAASSIGRRMGLSPSARGSMTNCTCPDIFELADGNFAVVGTDRTEELRDQLPPDAGVASYEKIVVITRD